MRPGHAARCFPCGAAKRKLLWGGLSAESCRAKGKPDKDEDEQEGEEEAPAEAGDLKGFHWQPESQNANILSLRTINPEQNRSLYIRSSILTIDEVPTII